MTDEKMKSNYKAVEAKWLASRASHDLLEKLRAMPIDAEHKIDNCVCFGTGIPSGIKVGVAFEEDKKIWHQTRPRTKRGAVSDCNLQNRGRYHWFVTKVYDC
jgi:hypothetical protein